MSACHRARLVVYLNAGVSTVSLQGWNTITAIRSGNRGHCINTDWEPVWRPHKMFSPSDHLMRLHGVKSSRLPLSICLKKFSDFTLATQWPLGISIKIPLISLWWHNHDVYNWDWSVQTACRAQSLFGQQQRRYHGEEVCQNGLLTFENIKCIFWWRTLSVRHSHTDRPTWQISSPTLEHLE